MKDLLKNNQAPILIFVACFIAVGAFMLGSGWEKQNLRKNEARGESFGFVEECFTFFMKNTGRNIGERGMGLQERRIRGMEVCMCK